MIIYEFEQRSEAWFAEKCGRVTGTRFKNLIAGESTKTYKDLVTDIACEMITHRIEETYTNAIMEHGIETEDTARKEYMNITGAKVFEYGLIIPDENNKYNEWIGYSPDGLIKNSDKEPEGLLEIKCPLMKTHLNYIAAHKLPAEYRHQVQAGMFVTGLNYCDFMSYVEGMKPFILRIEPDYELFEEYKMRLDKLIEQVNELLQTYEKYDYYGKNDY